VSFGQGTPCPYIKARALNLRALPTQGDQDFQAPIQPVRDYIDALLAPYKELVVLEGEGHTAVLSLPEMILATIKH
jgi:hypothetical protein